MVIAYNYFQGSKAHAIMTKFILIELMQWVHWHVQLDRLIRLHWHF